MCISGWSSSVAACCRHQDMAYWPPFTSDTATATCWLAVSDATVENGCMRFVPESHKEAELRHHAPGTFIRNLCSTVAGFWTRCISAAVVQHFHRFTASTLAYILPPHVQGFNKIADSERPNHV